MIPRLFHIFRNTPMGRETLLQSTYFAKQLGATLTIYIPGHIKFLMYFDNDVVQVDLDRSYLSFPETAREHAAEIAGAAGLDPSFLEPRHFTASTLPDIPTDFDFMCCPRSISDLSSKLGLGYIGPRVRSIVNAAKFPVMIASPVFKPWKSIAVFFGGSANTVNTLKLGFRIQRKTGLPLKVFTQAERPAEVYRKKIAVEELEDEMNERVEKWTIFESGTLEENLYETPHDALVILGAFGHGVIREILFGSKMEFIQSNIPNDFLIVGPKYSASM